MKVQKVFDPKGIIHYPCDEKTVKKCKCGRSAHGMIQKKCDFYLYSQLGKPSFSVVEYKSRLRESSNQIEYPKCIHEEGDPDEPTSASNYTNGSLTQGKEVDNDADDDDAGDDDSDEDDVDFGDMLPPGVEDLLEEDDDDDALDIEKMFNEDEVVMKEIQPTEEQIQLAIDTEFNTTLDKIIAEADELSAQQLQAAIDLNWDADDDLPFDDLDKMKTLKTVLADIFHLMDRAKLPMHHEYKALFFRCLRAAIFIMHKEDVDQVREILSSNQGDTWERKMAFDFDYIKLRVRRRVPPPTVLYNRMRAVYDFFKDKIDSKKNNVLFSKENKHKFECMLELVKQGYASDPTNISLYVPKTDKFGRNMKDKDGLQLYRCTRGTNNLEGLHQFLTTSFGHTVAGPRYSDNLSVILRHHYNWRMSRKNRPGFPKLQHYDGRMIDRINMYYETIYGHPKYREWSTFNENLPVQSLYGILPVNNELTSPFPATENDIKLIQKNQTLKYLSERQKTPFPYLPIRGANERKLVYKKLKEIVANNDSLSNQSVFEKLANDWNSNEVSIEKKIFPKLPSHFIKYVKKWRKNQDIRDAAVGSGANKLSSALEYVPDAAQPMQNFEPVSLNDSNIYGNETGDTPTNPTETTAQNSILEPPTEGVQLLCQAVGTQTETTETETTQTETTSNEDSGRRKRKRRCQGYNGLACPIPDRCKGHSDRGKCILNPNRDVTRSRPQPSQRRCTVCHVLGCPGGRNKSKCTGGTNNI